MVALRPAIVRPIFAVFCVVRSSKQPAEGVTHDPERSPVGPATRDGRAVNLAVSDPGLKVAFHLTSLPL
jgi:hypothetical protein